MPAIGFAVPILSGKEERHRQFLADLAGPRREEYEAAFGGVGVTRQMVWHQQTPDGPLAVVYMESDDIEAMMQGIASSKDSLLREFREQVKDVHGIDLASDPSPQLEQIFDDRR